MLLPIDVFVRALLTLSTAWTFVVAPPPGSGSPALTTTREQARHATVPVEDADAWFVPDHAPDAEEKALKAGADALARGQHARALTLVRAATADPVLGGYARLYQARAHVAAGNHDAARRTADALALDASTPYLLQQARYLAAETAVSTGDARAAIAHLEALLSTDPLDAPRALLALARAHEAAGEMQAADILYTRIYYEHPLATQAAEARKALAARTAGAPMMAERAVLEFGRGERLFNARERAEAQRAFEAALPHLTGDVRAMAELRLAELHVHAGRHAAARQALAAHLKGPREAEARYFDLMALRGLGRHDAFVSAVRRLVDDHPDSSWAGDALNALGTYYILEDDDDAAARVFTELFDRHRTSAHAERAAWKAGWHAYRSGNFAEAIRIFEVAAGAFPRSSNRPSWLYWAGRAYAQSGDRDAFAARHETVLADYAHSYYGRQAARRLGIDTPTFTVARAADRRSDRTTEHTARDAYPNGLTFHRLLRAGLYDDAFGEMRMAEKVWGTSPALQATVAWTVRQQGDPLRASVLMKRAYPQYLSREGALLPDDVLRVTYPVEYWGLIRKYAAAHRLDPYLIAALIAQESGYNPSARSAANAVGLMQVVPSTGRAWARKLGIRNFTTRSLTDPEINIRIGTAYFADQVRQLGSVHAALAAYNAGPTPTRRWLTVNAGLERDEWIDAITYPETQFYVKRILGTADDYRALYGNGFDPSLSRAERRAQGAAGN